MERTNQPLTNEAARKLMALDVQDKEILTYEKLDEWYTAWGGQCYVSFSGGKDSTVLAYLAAWYLSSFRTPPWELNLVFVNTGLEYPEIQKFVNEYADWLRREFPRVNVNLVRLRPKMNIRQVVTKYGYSIVSKEVANNVWLARRGNKYRMMRFRGEMLDKDGNKSIWNCDNWAFLLDAPFLVSSECCHIMKKRAAHTYERESREKPIVAMMAEEGRQRFQTWTATGCNAFEGKRPMGKPMSFWTEQDVLRFIVERNLPYASVYGDIVASDGENDYDATLVDCPLHCTGCQRTGCMFCGFGSHLESGLFMEQVRIVKEMRAEDKRNGRTGNMVRPRYLVWENVVGAFSSNRGRDFHAVLEEIARIAEPGFSLSGLPEKWKWTKAGAIDGDGWSIAWRTHDAKDWGKTIRDSRTGNVIRLGTPQRRRRISVVADFGGESAAQIQFDRESVSGHPAASGTAGERPAGAAESGFNPAVARSLTARADGSPCADRGPNIVCSPYQGGCDGGGKGALVQTEKSGTLGTGNDQTIFCLQGNGIDRADTAGCNGKCWKADESYTLNTIDRPAVCAEVACMNPWDAQSARVYDQDGAWHSLNANENGGMARDSVLCAGFKAGQGAQAGGIGYSEEVSPTLAAAPSGTNQTPAVVALDMTHACDVIRECGEQAPSLQARMGTGGNQVPLTYQDVTGTLSPGAHAGSYNGQDAYNDMLVVSSEISPSLRAKENDPYRADMQAYVASVDCRNFREGGEVNGTLQAKESGQSLNLNNTVRQNMVVRRLTPMECERLQGFPDGWTDIGDWIKTDKRGREIKVKGSADSPRYKALGNSIALPFWDWMLRRMERYLPEDATLGSLFDGIAGFPLIWERIHGRGTARWASEIEPFPIAVTKKWFGEE